MTEKQRKLLFVLAKQKGMDRELLHSYVEAQTGKQSIAEVTTQEAKIGTHYRKAIKLCQGTYTMFRLGRKSIKSIYRKAIRYF